MAFLFLELPYFKPFSFSTERQELAWYDTVLEKSRKNTGLAISWSEFEY